MTPLNRSITSMESQQTTRILASQRKRRILAVGVALVVAGVVVVGTTLGTTMSKSSTTSADTTTTHSQPNAGKSGGSTSGGETPTPVFTPTTETSSTTQASDGWSVQTYAGTGSGFLNGDRTEAHFDAPMDVMFDVNGNMYIADSGNSVIRMIDKQGNVTTYAGSDKPGLVNGFRLNAQLQTPRFTALDQQGLMYFTEETSHSIRMIDAQGEVVVYAGVTGHAGADNGDRLSATFNDIYGLAFGKDGSLFVADAGNHVIRKIDRESQQVSIFAGTVGTSGDKDGPSTAATFSSPCGMAFDKEWNLYVVDRTGNRIRKIDSSGLVSTYAGTGTASLVDGSRENATFNGPTDLAFDKDGNMYITDAKNQVIRHIDQEGVVTTLVGKRGETGFVDGNGSNARFSTPFGLAMDSNGFLWVMDEQNNAVRRVSK